MQEMLPWALGCVAGLLAVGFDRRKWPIGTVLCIVLGAAASVINGELRGPLWSLFVSFDAAQVWLGAVLSASLVWSWRRMRTTS